VPRHRQRPRNPDLLDGDDVHRPDGRIARQQFAGGLAERPGQGADMCAWRPFSLAKVSKIP